MEVIQRSTHILIAFFVSENYPIEEDTSPEYKQQTSLQLQQAKYTRKNVLL